MMYKPVPVENMKQLADKSFVVTVKERCRVCYTCVRECPAKAIRIVDGQAEIMGDRCINCGNCVRVCSQGAKRVVDTTGQVRHLLTENGTVAAIIAPSFPAEFDDVPPERLIGMLRRLGFTLVTEVAFGADLVAREYRELLHEHPEERFIASTCPAVITYVEKYHPDLVPNLAPIVSPMIAMARALRKEHGDKLKIVFIGPCIAKKQESVSPRLHDEIDAVLTFIELRKLFLEMGIGPDDAADSEFNPPYARLGALFSISRGLLQAASITEDLIVPRVIATEGRVNFVEAIREFETGDLDINLLEVLCCHGCIMGPGISSNAPLFSRRSKVSNYVRSTVQNRDKTFWNNEMERFDTLNMRRVFKSNDQRIPVENMGQITLIMAGMGKFSPEDELNCGACGYETCYDHAVAIYKGLAESEMCLPYTIDQLRKTIDELDLSHRELASTQEALMHSEKLASMGQLAAGIAHEVNNPLGVVLMYAHMLHDDCGDNLALRDDLALIAEQADRCKKIVAGLLGFARQHKVVLEPTDVHELIDRSLMTIPQQDDIHVNVLIRLDCPVIEIDRDQIIQVLTNLISNACAAMPDGGTLTIEAAAHGDDRVDIRVIDTGIGIPKENISKIFEPFFTTKQLGKGTGLGLAVTYGIVKMHSGDITLKSNADPAAGPTGTIFTVTLPRRAPGIDPPVLQKVEKNG